MVKGQVLEPWPHSGAPSASTVQVVPAALKSRKGNPNAIGALSSGDRVALLIQPTSRSPVKSFAPFGGTTEPFHD